MPAPLSSDLRRRFEFLVLSGLNGAEAARRLSSTTARRSAACRSALAATAVLSPTAPLPALQGLSPIWVAQAHAAPWPWPEPFWSLGR